MSDMPEVVQPIEKRSEVLHPMVKTSERPLRLTTYLSPGISVGLFELLRDYLEKRLGVNAVLIYESRWSGPPTDRPDPFTTDDTDIAIMCSTAYLRLREADTPQMALCHAAAVHAHHLANDRPVYFAEVVVHQDNAYRLKDIDRLKGCRWVYNDDISLSGNIMMRAELKKHGYDTNFFSSTCMSGSHHASIQHILDRTAEVASIDSNTLTTFRTTHPAQAQQLHVVKSVGPMPIYPIVFNTRLPEATRDAIEEGLLELTSLPEWGQRLLQHGVASFTTIDESFYDLEDDIKSIVKNMKTTPAYY